MVQFFNFEGKRKRNMELISFRVDPSLFDRIEQQSEDERKGRSEIVRKLLKKGLK